MDPYVPPIPARREKGAPLWRRLADARRSALSVFMLGSHKQAVGAFRVPGLPGKGRRWLYLVRDPELVRRVLTEEAARFPKGPETGILLRDLIGEGIFGSDGETWERQRRMVDPAFALARLKDVFPMMVEAAEAMLARLAPQAGRGAVAIDVEMSHVTADIIFRTLFTEPLTRAQSERTFANFQTYQRVAYRLGMLRLAGLPEWSLPGRGKARRAGQGIRDVLAEAIGERFSRHRAGEPDPRRDILAALLDAIDVETGRGFGFEELIDQLATLFLAGHETSASALAWSLYLVAKVPEVQERMRREVSTALAESAPVFADLRKLPFVRDVFRETLRLYPPLAFVGRRPEEGAPLGERRTAGQSLAFLPFWLLHRHRLVWQQPDAFDPDRFATDNGKEGLRRAWLPFSAGPRVCLGAGFALQEAVLILACLVRRYRFLPVEGHEPLPVAHLTLRSANGIRLRVEPV